MIIMTMYCLSLRQNAVSEFQPYFSGWISLSRAGCDQLPVAVQHVSILIFLDASL